MSTPVRVSEPPVTVRAVVWVPVPMTFLIIPANVVVPLARVNVEAAVVLLLPTVWLAAVAAAATLSPATVSLKPPRSSVPAVPAAPKVMADDADSALVAPALRVPA